METIVQSKKVSVKEKSIYVGRDLHQIGGFIYKIDINKKTFTEGKCYEIDSGYALYRGKIDYLDIFDNDSIDCISINFKDGDHIEIIQDIDELTWFLVVSDGYSARIFDIYHIKQLKDKDVKFSFDEHFEFLSVCEEFDPILASIELPIKPEKLYEMASVKNSWITMEKCVYILPYLKKCHECKEIHIKDDDLYECSVKNHHICEACAIDCVNDTSSCNDCTCNITTLNCGHILCSSCSKKTNECPECKP
jgi:hypothetical protein